MMIIKHISFLQKCLLMTSYSSCLSLQMEEKTWNQLRWVYLWLDNFCLWPDWPSKELFEYQLSIDISIMYFVYVILLSVQQYLWGQECVWTGDIFFGRCRRSTSVRAPRSSLGQCTGQENRGQSSWICVTGSNIPGGVSWCSSQHHRFHIIQAG